MNLVDSDVILIRQCVEAALAASELIQRLENVFLLDGFAEYGGNEKVREMRDLLARLEMAL